MGKQLVEDSQKQKLNRNGSQTDGEGLSEILTKMSENVLRQPKKKKKKTDKSNEMGKADKLKLVCEIYIHIQSNIHKDTTVQRNVY